MRRGASQLYVLDLRRYILQTNQDRDGHGQKEAKRTPGHVLVVGCGFVFLRYLLGVVAKGNNKEVDPL